MEAYQSALKRAKKAKLEAVAFLLLGAGCQSNWMESIKIGVCAIETFEGYPELKKIHHYGYQTFESTELMKNCIKYCSPIKYEF
jgi:O-acetyl-ADP-ribose deacetylase (regulator of RNase III)